MAGFGFPGAAEAPGFQRLLSGAVFPLGLILVVFTGAELFTGNNAVLMPGALARRYGWGKVARNWTLVWMGNFAGALFFTYFPGGSARRAVVGNVAGSGLQYCAGEGIAAVEHGFPARRGRQLAGMSWPYGSE